MKRILFDVDGVLADIDHSAANLLELLYPEVKIDRTPPWPRIWYWPDEVLGGDQEKVQAFWRTMHNNPDWFLAVPLQDDAIPLVVSGDLYRLQEYYDVYAVTNRPAHLREVTEFWLHAVANFPVPVITINGPKGPLAKAMGAELLIDDRIENVESALSHGVDARLIARPYNENTSLERTTLGTVVAALGNEVAAEGDVR